MCARELEDPTAIHKLCSYHSPTTLKCAAFWALSPWLSSYLADFLDSRPRIAPTDHWTTANPVEIDTLSSIDWHLIGQNTQNKGLNKLPAGLVCFLWGTEYGGRQQLHNLEDFRCVPRCYV